MLEKAKGEDATKGKRKKDEIEVSVYEIVNTLIAHGHDKETILKTYSKDELSMFYEKCIKLDRKQHADYIESVIIGIGGAFGGTKKIEKLLNDMRK